MGTMASQITSLTIVYSIVYSGADQRKHQSSVSLAFVRGIHRGPVNSPHKLPVMRKMFPFDDVIMKPHHISQCFYIAASDTTSYQSYVKYHFVLCISYRKLVVNTLWPRQNGRHFADNIFKRIFVIGNVWISLKISMKFVPNVQIMSWRRPGDWPLSEPMIVRLPTHICVARPQWVQKTYNGVETLSIECENYVQDVFKINWKKYATYPVIFYKLFITVCRMCQMFVTQAV